jgi:hypothetical protein
VANPMSLQLNSDRPETAADGSIPDIMTTQPDNMITTQYNNVIATHNNMVTTPSNIITKQPNIVATQLNNAMTTQSNYIIMPEKRYDFDAFYCVSDLNSLKLFSAKNL